MIVKFSDPQGKVKGVGAALHYCNPDSITAWTDEKQLFCTRRCVWKMSPPRQVRSPPSTAILPAHMLVAVSDYELTDRVEGKGIVRPHAKKRRGGIHTGWHTQRITDTGQAPARFTVIVWR